MTKKNKAWVFQGNVLVNGVYVKSHAEYSTYAPSQKKAYNNIRHRYKQENDLARWDDVQFVGDMRLADRIVVTYDEFDDKFIPGDEKKENFRREYLQTRLPQIPEDERIENFQQLEFPFA